MHSSGKLPLNFVRLDDPCPLPLSLCPINLLIRMLLPLPVQLVWRLGCRSRGQDCVCHWTFHSVQEDSRWRETEFCGRNGRRGDGFVGERFLKPGAFAFVVFSLEFRVPCLPLEGSVEWIVRRSRTTKKIELYHTGTNISSATRTLQYSKEKCPSKSASELHLTRSSFLHVGISIRHASRFATSAITFPYHVISCPG